MKQVIIALALSVAGVGCACRNAEPMPAASVGGAEVSDKAWTLKVKAEIDGSDELRVGPAGLTWVHRQWQGPDGVVVNGTKWATREDPTMSWDRLGVRVSPGDFAPGRYRVVRREGRDIVAVESTRLGVSVFFADTPDGSGEYQVVIEFGRR